MKKKRIKTILKTVLYFLFFYLHIFEFLLKILAKIRKNHPCIILLYHRIVDDHSEYLDKGPAVHHRKGHFEREIPYLKKNYQILSMDEAVRYMRGGSAFKRPTIAITFDDGYRDNFIFAYPVLKKYEVPATLYLATRLIGTTDRTWTDQIELALMETKENHFALSGLLGGERLQIETKKEKERANIKIAEALKIRPDTERIKLMGELFRVLRIDGNIAGNPRSRTMLNWDEVRKMAENSMTIGSHSHTHPILSQMPLEEAKENILDSKKTIEEKLGFRVKHFSFPNGRREDFTEELRDYCRKIGFESVASVIYGTNDTKNGRQWNLKRIVAISPVWMLAGELVKLFWESITKIEY